MITSNDLFKDSLSSVYVDRSKLFNIPRKDAFVAFVSTSESNNDKAVVVDFAGARYDVMGPEWLVSSLDRSTMIVIVWI